VVEDEAYASLLGRFVRIVYEDGGYGVRTIVGRFIRVTDDAFELLTERGSAFIAKRVFIKIMPATEDRP
jgi:hypothetical protein